MSTAKPSRSSHKLLQRRFITALLLCMSLLAFHSIALATATATVVLSVPASEPIGADFSFSATFDNSGTTAYGPFIDIVFPATGADGNDGISFTGATYLGLPLTAVTLTFPAGGCVAHPYAQDTSHAPLQVCGTPGDTLVVLQLPFGSFTPNQPPAAVTVNAHLSDLAIWAPR